MECNKDENQKKPCKEKCELALEEGKTQVNPDQFAMLMDDEELELQESQAGPNPVTCSAHFATNGLIGCSFCKGWFYLLAIKFLMFPTSYLVCFTPITTMTLGFLFPDLLAKFPPNAVKMKSPFCMQPWDSSPELVKKMFKVHRSLILGIIF